MPAPTIYVIAGCNGAGKTTFAKEFLPHEVKCLRFYNADEVARGLSPLDPSAGAIKAGRVLLNEIRESLNRHETFALESTLSGKTYIRTFKLALCLGYELELHYLWLSNVEQAIARVRRRVRMGGHNVDWFMSNDRKRTAAGKQPAFVARAQRAFGRVARKARTENRRLRLAPVVWSNDRSKSKAAHG